MAAFDTFHSINATLSPAEKELYRGLLAEHRTELLAARSEEARVRIVYELQKRLHEARSATRR